MVLCTVSNGLGAIAFFEGSSCFIGLAVSQASQDTRQKGLVYLEYWQLQAMQLGKTGRQ
jgi:hypothetical protein